MGSFSVALESSCSEAQLMDVDHMSQTALIKKIKGDDYRVNNAACVIRQTGANDTGFVVRTQQAV
jgi:hypothetical protein